MRRSTVLLIGGPGGSGKTTLADAIAKQHGFVMISEDTLWAKLKANCPPDDWRTEEEELIIQAAVIDQLGELVRERRDIALEFILYSDPPRPLLAYKKALDAMDARLGIVVLNPAPKAILDRKRSRGRENEQNDEREAELTGNQTNCLISPHIPSEWLLDNSEMTVAETVDAVMRRIR